jgi:nicotinamidase-related amidase
VPKRALIVIDVQIEYFTGNLRIEYPPVEQSLANILRAMDAAQAHALPVVAVQHVVDASFPIFAAGSHAVELHPEVRRRPIDHRVQKSKASALSGTDLSEWLRSRDIDTLSVVGYMTHNCDDSTVRQAAHEGFRVEWLHDAAGSLPYANSFGQATAEEIHRVFGVVMHTGFAAVCSTTEWIAAVERGEPLEPDNVYLSNQRALGQAR